MRKRIITFLTALTFITALLASCSGTASENVAKAIDTIQGFRPGQWDGNTYTNEKFKLEVTLPENWYIYTTEELEQTFGQVFNDLEDTENELDEGSFIPLFLVTDNEDPNNVYVNMNLIATRTIIEPNFEEEYTEEALGQLKAQFESYGSVTAEVAGEMKLGGRDAFVVKVNTKIDGTEITQYQRIYQLFDGGYLLSLTVTGIDENDLDEAISYINFD